MDLRNILTTALSKHGLSLSQEIKATPNPADAGGTFNVTLTLRDNFTSGSTPKELLALIESSIVEEIKGEMGVKPVIPLMPTSDEALSEMSFSLEGEEPNHPASGHVIINNPTNTTVNVSIGACLPKVDKKQQIERNLLALTKSGIEFKRCSNYHIRTIHDNAWWNFYLTSEKFHPDGEPSENKGIDEFIKMVSGK